MAKWIVLEGYRDGKGRNFNEADILDDMHYPLAEMRLAGLAVCPYVVAADIPIAAFKRQVAQNNPGTQPDLDIESYLQNAGIPTTFSGLQPGGAPTGAAGGDLSGSYPNPFVARLQSRPVNSAAPVPGQALIWSGVDWAPGSAGATLAGDVSGPAGGNTLNSVQGTPIIGAPGNGSGRTASQFFGYNPQTGQWSAQDPGGIRAYGEAWFVRERFGSGTPVFYPYSQNTGANSVATSGSVGHDWTNETVWDTHYRWMHVRIRARSVTDGSISRQDILFQPRYSDITDWLNNNVANNGSEFTGSATVEPYDIVDPAVPNGSHIWAKNHIFATMFEKANAKRRYKRPTAQVMVHPNATAHQNVCQGLDAMWTQAFGFQLNSGGFGSWTQTDLNCFWITKSSSKMYRIPKWPFGARLGSSSIIPPSGSRQFSSGTDSYQPGSTAALYNSASGPVYGTWDNTNGTFQSVSDIKSWRRGFGSRVNQNTTSVMGIPIVDANDNTRFALLIKPMNIDQFFFNGIDFADRLQAECVVNRGENLGSNNLRVLASDILGFNVGQRNTHQTPVLMRDIWGAFMGTYRGNTFGHGKTCGTAMFQVRDRRTGRVSLPMTQHLELKDNIRGVQVAITLEQSRKF